MMDGKIFFDQPIKNDVKTYDNIQNIAIGRTVITLLVVYYIVITLIITII